MNVNELLRELPKVDLLLQESEGSIVIEAVRQVINDLRAAILSGQIEVLPTNADILAAAKKLSALGLKRVINATGIPLHTNLGRAPLSNQAANAVYQAALGYCNLEYDLDTGRRGSRMQAIIQRLIRISKAEDAICVNNNAAAVLLCISAICNRGSVIISRGELVEIGGSFRIPEVIQQGGASLKEVGTTNKTHLKDYKNAIDADTTAILKVHTSNYRIIGFTQDASLDELNKLANESNIPLIYDLGGGSLIKLSPHEPCVQDIVAQGVDLLCFSGDKLLGGPQAGIVLGKAKYIKALRRHPLYRALRMDKLTIAALDATLQAYENNAQIPIIEMLTVSPDTLEQKANKLCSLIGSAAEVVSTIGQAGGGALPGEDFSSFAVAISGDEISLNKLQEHLRHWHIPIIARLSKGQLLLDVRTIEEANFDEIAAALHTMPKNQGHTSKAPCACSEKGQKHE